MGARGPQPESARVLALRGSWRAGARAAGEPTWPVGAPACPKWLPAKAKTEWRRIVPLLLEAGILSPLDQACLAAYCCTWSHLVDAVRELHKHGYTVTTARGNETISPWVFVVNSCTSQLMKLAAAFGMTPATRARVTALEATGARPSGKKRNYFNDGDDYEAWQRETSKERFSPEPRTPVRDRNSV